MSGASDLEERLLREEVACAAMAERIGMEAG